MKVNIELSVEAVVSSTFSYYKEFLRKVFTGNLCEKALLFKAGMNRKRKL
jgi:hypothetical protein